MELQWFRRRGLIYVPTSFPGWLVCLAGIAGAVYAFRKIDSHSHSASDTLIDFVFYLLTIGAVYNLIAWLTTRAKKSTESLQK